jgi:hypothetical protein
MKNAPTSHNRTVYASALKRLGLRKTAVGLRPWCGFISAKDFCARKMLRIFLYRAQKSFVNSRNVKRKFFYPALFYASAILGT